MQLSGSPTISRVVPFGGDIDALSSMNAKKPKSKPTMGKRGSDGSTRLVTAITMLQRLGALYNWCAWTFIMVMVSSQFLSLFWNSVETSQNLYFGQDPLLGPYEIGGSNDEPYADRVLACIEDGRYYRPVQLSEALTWKQNKPIDAVKTQQSVNGYRLVQREGLVLDSAALAAYSGACVLIAATLETICETCAALGYNVTQDSLRVLNGVQSTTTYLIANSLPVLVMPYWDGTIFSRFAIPSYDGSACVIRLLGRYLDNSQTAVIFRGVNRTIRETKTVEWLRRPNGVWRNGWYEDQEGGKWYSDVISTNQHSALGISHRQFDMLRNQELDCVRTKECKEFPVTEHWGSKFSTTDQPLYYNSITISNGHRYGVFLFEQPQRRTATSIYDWETLISNLSLALLLPRWMLVMYALQYGYFEGKSSWYNAGIGCLANSRSFNLLPIALLPRLKTTLSAFWTIGCEFEGEQKALSEAWFVMYPAILELVLLYYSLLNIISKVLRRRISDAPFGPSVIFFCLMHWARMDIAQSSWFGIDGRVTTLISSSEFEELRLIDFFTTKTPLRMNSNVQSLMIILSSIERKSSTRIY
ncbi:hypothetical protein FI667_g9538, partial [Globisporangium splendens]